MVESTKKAVIGGDLGGTKLALGVFPVVGGRVCETAVVRIKVDTQIGVEGLRDTMKKGFAAAAAAAPEYRIVGMGIGSPGRPLLEHSEGAGAFVVTKDSARNLERPDHRGELTGVNLQKVFQEEVPVPLFVNNDGIVQLQAMLADVLSKPGMKARFLDKKVVYVGMGTGLGGGFAAVSKEGKVSVHTDGHIYDIRLGMKHDMQTLKTRSAALPAKDKLLFAPDGHSIRAEDILSGTAFTKMTGKQGESISTAKGAEEVRGILELMGRGLAELVEKIHNATLKKLDPDVDWPQGDLDKVKGTSTVLMGGGMANNEHLMKIIEETAQAELTAQGIRNVAFVAVPDKETTLAAANTVLKDVLHFSREYAR